MKIRDLLKQDTLSLPFEVFYANDITNAHVYSMNKPDIAAKIQSNLSDILGK